MDLRRLRQVVVLAESGSYLIAANQLNLSPSALSRSIQALEEECGLTFFDRGRGGVFPTTTGAMLVDLAKPLLANARELESTLKAIGSDQMGEAIFGIGPLPASFILPSLLSDIIKDVPGLSVHVEVDIVSMLLKRVQDRELDFLICSRTALPPARDLELEELGVFRICLLVRNGHPLEQIGQVSSDDIIKYPFLGGGGHKNRYKIGEFLNIDKLNPNISCGNYDILLKIVRSTDAICLATPALLHANGTADDYAFIELIGDTFTPRETFLCVQLEGRTLSKAALAVKDRIRTLFSDLALL